LIAVGQSGLAREFDLRTISPGAGGFSLQEVACVDHTDCKIAFSGTLVALSDVSALPESGGEVGFYFDPQSGDSIADCLRRVASLPVEHCKEGLALARAFPWSACVQQTIARLRNFL
jgi:hypothetical protein